MKTKRRFILFNLLLVLWLLGATLTAQAQQAQPWETPQGQACFEQWITVSMGKLNAYNGSADFNRRKPWSINKYGVLEGNPQVGPRSVAAPDDFPQYNNNKYWWMWDSWIPANSDGTWRFPEWNGASVESIRSFVTNCVAASAGNTSGGGNNTGAVGTAQSACTWTGTWDTSYNKMELTQNGDKVTGSYMYNGGKLEGTVSGSVLAGTWTEGGSSGGFQFTIAADCNSFSGGWGRGSDASSGGSWSGTRSGALPPPRPQPDPSVTTMTLQAAERRVIAGQAILIPVWLVNGNNLANFNFEVKYDPSVVRLEGTLIKGNLLDNALFSGNTNDAGLVRIGLAQRSGSVAGTGTVANIPFRAVGKPGTRTPLDLTVTTINDPNGGALTIDRINGEILIMDQDGTFPPSSGGGNGGGGNGGGGTASGGPVMIPRGSCDGDQRLTEIDALCALDMSTGLRQPVLLIMDMDRNGDVTSRDAVLVLQQSVNQ